MKDKVFKNKYFVFNIDRVWGLYLFKWCFVIGLSIIINIVLGNINEFEDNVENFFIDWMYRGIINVVDIIEVYIIIINIVEIRNGLFLKIFNFKKGFLDFNWCNVNKINDIIFINIGKYVVILVYL